MYSIARRLGPFSLMLLLLLLAACAATPPVETRMHADALRIVNPITAYGMWVAQDETQPANAPETSYTGMMLAQVYIHVRDEPLLYGPIALSLPFGWMACPAMVTVAGDGSQIVYGRCTITTTDDDQLFAEIRCVRSRSESCEGSFRLTGGTARYRNTIGGGPLLLQPASQAIILAAREFESARAPRCRLPIHTNDGISRLNFAAAQPAGLADRGCRLERLPFVPVAPRPDPHLIAMRE